MSASPLFKYNPQRVDPAELEEVTLGRGDLLDRLENHLRREAGEAHPQHLVLIGPRGIGKTHLLTILHHRCLTDPVLSRAWLPLLFPEELYDVVNLRTFYRRVLRAMREAKGVSLSELAARTGMTRGNLARLESQKNATLRTLRRYAAGLDCELEINVVSAEVTKKKPRGAAG